MFARDPLFWRAGAVSSLIVTLAILAMLTTDTMSVITTGGRNVPAYTVINRQIGYEYVTDRNEYMPTIGGQEPLFGRIYSPVQAEALVRHGKLVIQSRACLDCHTMFGTGAYYAPDLTKAWLDPAWEHLWMPMTRTHTRADAIAAFLQHPEQYPTWTREMPNLRLTQDEAQAVVAYLKWVSAVNTNGFPFGFKTAAAGGT